MESVRDKLSAAQAKGDLAGCRAALEEAREKGAEPKQIEEALQELDKLEAARAAPTEGSGQVDGSDVAAAQEAAAAAQRLAAAAAAGDPEGGPSDAEVAAILKQRAEALKKRGNEKLKESTKAAAREAVECFTAGIEVNCQDGVLNAQLYGNRALVRINKLRQFVEAVDDCRKAIDCDPKNVKNYWRAAKASMHLELLKNAIEFCELGLRHKSDDGDLLKMKETCAEKLAGQQQRKTDLAAAAQKSDFNAEEAMAVQEKVNSYGEQLEVLKNSVYTKQRERAKANLTKGQLDEMPEDVKTFVSVGRSFLRTDKSKINDQIVNHMESLEKEIPSLTNSFQEIEKRKVAAETELKEMINSFKQQLNQGAAGAA